jgi:hypothetical protein
MGSAHATPGMPRAWLSGAEDKSFPGWRISVSGGVIQMSTSGLASTTMTFRLTMARNVAACWFERSTAKTTPMSAAANFILS